MLNSNELKKKLRDWHIWLGVFLSLPLVIVGITTIFLAVEQQLKLDKYYISSKIFPGYWGEKNEKRNEIKAFYKDSNGTEYYGHKYGLIVKNAQESKEIEFFDKHDIREINSFKGNLIVGAKEGLFLQENDTYKKVLKQEIWNLYLENEIVYIISKDGVFTCSSDFLKCEEIALKNEIKPMTEISLKKLNLDLHTGKALLGKFDWIWQSLLGIAILFFVYSGFYLWYKKKFRKKDSSKE